MDLKDSKMEIIFRVSGWDKEDSGLETFDNAFALFEDMMKEKAIIVLDTKSRDIPIKKLIVEQLIVLSYTKGAWGSGNIKVMLKGISPRFMYNFEDPAIMRSLLKIEKELRKARETPTGVIYQNDDSKRFDFFEELDDYLQILATLLNESSEFEKDEEPVAIAIDPSCDKLCVIFYKKINEEDRSLDEKKVNAMLVKASKENYPRRYV